jgi:hypothetical protein
MNHKQQSARPRLSLFDAYGNFHSIVSDRISILNNVSSLYVIYSDGARIEVGSAGGEKTALEARDAIIRHMMLPDSENPFDLREHFECSDGRIGKSK